MHCKAKSTLGRSDKANNSVAALLSTRFISFSVRQLYLRSWCPQFLKKTKVQKNRYRLGLGLGLWVPSLQVPTRITLCKVFIVLFKVSIDSSLTLALCDGGR